MIMEGDRAPCIVIMVVSIANDLLSIAAVDCGCHLVSVANDLVDVTSLAVLTVPIVTGQHSGSVIVSAAS